MRRQHGVLLPCLAIVSSILTLLFFFDYLRALQFPTRCTMTLSSPVYTLTSGDSTEGLGWGPKFHPRYRLYALHTRQLRQNLTGYPVIFVPGQRGSYKQARSIGRHFDNLNATTFDLFAIDFNEEWSALSGELISMESYFINECIQAILSQYRIQEKDRKVHYALPQSVIVIAHSMGAIAAQYAKNMKNYKRNSIQHVFFLGAPFQNRPNPFDPSMYEIYKDIRSYFDSNENITTYVSISGGYKDIMVPSASSIFPRVEQDLLTGSVFEASSEALESHMSEEKREASGWSNGFGMSLLTTAIPNVNTTTDHYGLLWCFQLLQIIVKSINGVLIKDLNTSTVRLINDGKERLIISKSILLGNNATFESISHIAKRMEYGYTDANDHGAYSLVLPNWIWRLFRLYFAELWTLTSSLIFCIFALQLQTWQRDDHRDLPTSVCQNPQLRAGSFPPLACCLHPFQLFSFPLPTVRLSFLLSDAGFWRQCRRQANICRVVIPALVFTLCLVAWSASVSVSSFFNAIPDFFFHEQLLTRFLIISASCVHVVGMLYVSAITIDITCRNVLAPIYSFWIVHLLKLRLPRALSILGIYSGVSLCVIFTSGEFNVNQVLAATVLITVLFVIISLGSLASGVQLTTPVTEDHFNYRQSLSLILALSCLSWAGNLVYAWYILMKPAIVWNNTFAWNSLQMLAMLWIILYLILFAHDNMLPRSPSAVFQENGDRDMAMTSNDPNRRFMRHSSKISKHDKAISVEECPHCVFEDGGDGAIYVECEVSKYANSKTTSDIWLGPTFKVVACDCFHRYRNEPSLHCDFCRRVCRLCGGGSGNRDEALRFERYLSENRMQSTIQWMIPYCLRFGAFMQIIFIPQAMSAHWLYYSSLYVSILILACHKLPLLGVKSEAWLWSATKPKQN